jgi:magnesium transporter
MRILTEADPERLHELLERDEFFWLDLRDPDEAALDVLGEVLGVHPVALEDTSEWGQRPKVETYPDQVFLVFYTVAAAPGGETDRLMEVHLYLSGHFVVTARRGDCAHMDLLRGHLEPPPGQKAEDEDYLIYRILDGLTDAYYPLIAATEERIDELEDEVLHRLRREHLERIYRLKQEVHAFERRVLAQRDYFPSAVDAIMNLPELSHGTRVYLRDVSDHLVQVAGELHRQSTDLVSLTETFFNANANKLNEVATRLSVLATYFVVATLITGFFGQNFGWLVGSIDSRTDFLLFGVGGLVAPMAALTAYLWRHRDDWR